MCIIASAGARAIHHPPGGLEEKETELATTLATTPLVHHPPGGSEEKRRRRGLAATLATTPLVHHPPGGLEEKRRRRGLAATLATTPLLRSGTCFFFARAAGCVLRPSPFVSRAVMHSQVLEVIRAVL